MRKNKNYSVVTKVISGQIAIVSLFSIAFLIYSGLLGAKSALYGGLAVVIPNLYFAYKIKKSAGKSAKKIVGSFYAGESGKFLMTVLMFALIFQDPEINVLAVLLTYAVTLTVFWFALLIRKY
ncbi:MAG: ATP synthase subunit I [Methyloprofundus sp.]|nr:ATP synthase subunit I [Methyloprofundus sp.]